MERFEVRRRKGELELCPQKKFKEPDEEVLITLEVEGEALVLIQQAIIASLVLTVAEAGFEKNTPMVKEITECQGFTPVLRALLANAGHTASHYRPTGAKKKVRKTDD